MKIAEGPRKSSSLGTADQPATPATGSAVAALERELAARKRGRVWKVLGALVAVLGAAYGFRALQRDREPEPPPRFVTAPVEIRDITETVESSGKLQPLTEVRVGTQVSGRVVRVHVDFNDTVKKGDLLAEIDPSLFGAQVSQVRGQLSAAQAQLQRARAAQGAAQLAFDRAKQLTAAGIASEAELEAAQNALSIAQADVVAASAQSSGLDAQLASASTTLGYTKIYSPIDGIVINRDVDPGQTVAASFSAPVLFVIAQDLTAMQVLADIDEADVGKIREGMRAEVRVDAFPEQTFAGTLTQIRYSPTEVQGVVTYAAVLDVRNERRELRPGMTATVTITTNAIQGKPALPSAALRFKPKDVASAGGPLELGPGERRVYLLGDTPPAQPGAGAAPPAPALLPRKVRVGITDGVWTELADATLGAGARVVTEERIPPGEQRRKFLGIF
jgi:HlyD family secretion protein